MLKGILVSGINPIKQSCTYLAFVTLNLSFLHNGSVTERFSHHVPLDLPSPLHAVESSPSTSALFYPNDKLHAYVNSCLMFRQWLCIYWDIDLSCTACKYMKHIDYTDPWLHYTAVLMNESLKPVILCTLNLDKGLGQALSVLHCCTKWWINCSVWFDLLTYKLVNVMWGEEQDSFVWINNCKKIYIYIYIAGEFGFGRGK